MTNNQYPNRRYGNDHDRYQWSYSPRREKGRFRSGARAGAFVVVPLEYFPLNPSGVPFKHPGAMVTPYPDLRHYTTRDYGLRVGVFRLLKSLEENAVRAVFPINAALLDRCEPLIERILQGGHEVAAHGLSTDHIHHAGLSVEEEESLIERTREAFSKKGLRPKIWMSPARNQSYNTPDLIRQFGFEICLDWEMDQTPVSMQTQSGPLICLPLHHELNDFNLLFTKNQSEEEWANQIISAAELLCEEHDSQGAQLFGFTLTPYISGLPFRTVEVGRILRSLAGMSAVSFAPVNDLLDDWVGAQSEVKKSERQASS